MQRPKIIHYCWFGPKTIPELECKCIESWKKYLPDWELKFWNEQNFDLDISLFAKQAYEAKQYAFVSDYVRAYVLYNYGGLYLDTDVEILPGFSRILDKNANIVGFETKSQVGTAIMAFVPKHQIIENFLKNYQGTFADKNTMNITANVAYLTDALVEKGLVLNRITQQVGDVIVYARDYFFPKKQEKDTFFITERTVAVHRCSGSWMTERQKKRGKNKFWIKVIRPVLRFCKKLLILLFGKKNIRDLEIKIRTFLR